MRQELAVLALLLAGGPCVTFADPPTAPVALQPPVPVQNNAVKDSAPQESSSAAAPAPAAATAAATSATAAPHSTSSATAEPSPEKLLLDQGYKPYMRKGEVVYCRRETPIGSHLASTLKCVTVAQAEAMAKEGRDTTERLQRNMSSCLANNNGRGVASCGN